MDRKALTSVEVETKGALWQCLIVSTVWGIFIHLPWYFTRDFAATCGKYEDAPSFHDRWPPWKSTAIKFRVNELNTEKSWFRPAPKYVCNYFKISTIVNYPARNVFTTTSKLHLLSGPKYWDVWMYPQLPQDFSWDSAPNVVTMTSKCQLLSGPKCVNN